MNAFAFSGLLIAVTCIGMAALVYFSNRRGRITQFWAMFCLIVAMWGVGAYFIATSENPQTTLMWCRLAHVPVIFIPVVFYHFVTRFINLRRQKALITFYLICFGFLILDATPLLISNVRKVFGQFYYTSPGILYPIFFLFYGGMVFISHFELWRFLVQHNDEQRRSLQLRWFFLASAIGFVGSLLCFPPAFGIDVYPYSNFAIPLYPVIMTYAIIRHHLMDIRVVIKKSLVYSILISCITAAYLVFVLVTERWFQGYLGYRSWPTTLFAAFLIGIFFHPFRNLIQKFVDRAIFKATPAELAEQREHLLTEVRKGDQMKAVATLAAGLAHEIKNPLTSVKTFTESLRTHHADPVFREKFEKIVGGEIERINSIVQQLLEFAKPVPPKLLPVEVPKLLDETLEFLSNDLVNHHVQVTRQYASQVKVLADPKQLRQVFLNLFLNSLQAMNGAGRLEVQTEVSGAELSVTIADNGPGIAPKDLPHIFEPFYTTKSNGTGLGLAVVQGIIKEHGGRIHVTSHLGRGTTVRINLRALV